MQGHVIWYRDIGDYLTQEQKLELVKNANPSTVYKTWENIKPDKHHDWLDQRGDDFVKYMPMGDKNVKDGSSRTAVFKMYSNGVKTNRDPWVYNSSKSELEYNMTRMIEYCNTQNLDKPTIDPNHVKWDAELGSKLKRLGSEASFDTNNIRLATYRPFFKQYLYFDQTFNSRLYLTPKFFPSNHNNLAICVPDKGKSKTFSALVADVMPDLHLIEQSQCFPLKSQRFINRNSVGEPPRDRQETAKRPPRDRQTIYA